MDTKFFKYRIQYSGDGYGDTVFEVYSNRKPTRDDAHKIAIEYHGAFKEDTMVLVCPVNEPTRYYILPL